MNDLQIKKSLLSCLGDSINPQHTDSKGWLWWREIEDEYERRTILIFKMGNRNWFVLPSYEEDFKCVHPNAHLK